MTAETDDDAECLRLHVLTLDDCYTGLAGTLNLLQIVICGQDNAPPGAPPLALRGFKRDVGNDDGSRPGIDYAGS